MAHKILIVDDEKINIAIVKFGLAQQRYEVVVANDGEEGLGYVRKHKPDLVVLDVQMPNMNGFEFMTELKNMEYIIPPPVIMLTGNETMQDVFKLEGVKGYFVKPVELQDLLKKIVECIGENPF
jgi:CheY-like chemotaxis protein